MCSNTAIFGSIPAHHVAYMLAQPDKIRTWTLKQSDVAAYTKDLEKTPIPNYMRSYILRGAKEHKSFDRATPNRFDPMFRTGKSDIDHTAILQKKSASVRKPIVIKGQLNTKQLNLEYEKRAMRLSSMDKKSEQDSKREVVKSLLERHNVDDIKSSRNYID